MLKRGPDVYKNWTVEQKATLVGCGTYPVGRKQRNELDLHDMTGNVWERCWDLNATNRRLRGGSWTSTADLCAVSFRLSSFPDHRRHDTGLRLARSS